MSMPTYCVSDQDQNENWLAGKTSRLTKAQRKRIKEFCLSNDGNKCVVCGNQADPNSLEINHRNGDPTDNRASNLELAHHVCNAREFHAKRMLSSPIVCVNEATSMHTTPEIKLNKTYEPEFRRWVFTVLLNAKKPDRYNPNKVLLNDLISSGAEHIGSSSMTTRRYLMKMLSSQGMLEIYRDSNGNVAVKFNDDTLYAYSPREIEALFPKTGQLSVLKNIDANISSSMEGSQ